MDPNNTPTYYSSVNIWNNIFYFHLNNVKIIYLNHRLDTGVLSPPMPSAHSWGPSVSLNHPNFSGFLSKIQEYHNHHQILHWETDYSQYTNPIHTKTTGRFVNQLFPRPAPISHIPVLSICMVCPRNSPIDLSLMLSLFFTQDTL